MDFKIDINGEIDKEYLEIDSSSDQYIKQLAISRIVSISNDWYYDNIGANLEEVFGEFVIYGKTDVKIKEKIYSALCVDDIFSDSNVYVEVTYNQNLEYKISVYIKSIEYQNTSINIDVILDLFNGKLVI